MCRNIKPLFNYSPPATKEEIRAASRQFVKKISGFSKPSKVNEAPFEEAVEEVAVICSRLLGSLESKSQPKSRVQETLKARARSEKRFHS